MAEKKRDRLGFVAAFDAGDRTIGTIRLIPLGLQAAPCEPVVMSLQPPPDQLREAWEVGRLVLDPECRAGADLLSRCLFLTLLHLVDSVSIANIFATCTPVLARLYRRFGFSIVSSLAGETQESFVLIHGDVPKVLTALARSAEEVGLVHKALARIDESEQ